MSKRRIAINEILTVAEFVLTDRTDGEEHDRYYADVDSNPGIQGAAEDAIRDAAIRAGATRYDMDEVARALVEQGLATTFTGPNGTWRVSVEIIDTERIEPLKVAGYNDDPSEPGRQAAIAATDNDPNHTAHPTHW